MDREGKLFNYNECVEEFANYTTKTNYYSSTNLKEIIGIFPSIATIQPK
jgi:hypothetical protein